jgi:hypothetical protein
MHGGVITGILDETIGAPSASTKADLRGASP